MSVATAPSLSVPILTDIDGVIRVGGTRVSLDTVLYAYNEGANPEEIVEQYPSLDLADVARFVGHSDVATTRGYIQHEGDRPRQVSEKAFLLLDV